MAGQFVSHVKVKDSAGQLNKEVKLGFDSEKEVMAAARDMANFHIALTGARLGELDRLAEKGDATVERSGRTLNVTCKTTAPHGGPHYQSDETFYDVTDTVGSAAAEGLKSLEQTWGKKKL